MVSLQVFDAAQAIPEGDNSSLDFCDQKSGNLQIQFSDLSDQKKCTRGQT